MRVPPALSLPGLGRDGEMTHRLLEVLEISATMALDFTVGACVSHSPTTGNPDQREFRVRSACGPQEVMFLLYILSLGLHTSWRSCFDCCASGLSPRAADLPSPRELRRHADRLLSTRFDPAVVDGGALS